MIDRIRLREGEAKFLKKVRHRAHESKPNTIVTIRHNMPGCILHAASKRQ
jgi:hypothetical protein